MSYTVLPSDLVGRIVVHKSAQADRIEGGAAGTVDIQTRKPLEFKQSLTTSLSAEAAYSTAAKSTDPAVTALLGVEVQLADVQVGQRLELIGLADAVGVAVDPDAQVGEGAVGAADGTVGCARSPGRWRVPDAV